MATTAKEMPIDTASKDSVDHQTLFLNYSKIA